MKDPLFLAPVLVTIVLAVIITALLVFTHHATAPICASDEVVVESLKGQACVKGYVP